ncbi:MAG: carbohydrate kinase family protein, partial [Planctomycetota bacterium]
AGAGDAFAATLTARLAEGAEVTDALVAATCNAASVIGHVDTQSGLLGAQALADAARSATLDVRSWSAASGG